MSNFLIRPFTLLLWSSFYNCLDSIAVPLAFLTLDGPILSILVDSFPSW